MKSASLHMLEKNYLNKNKFKRVNKVEEKLKMSTTKRGQGSKEI